MFEFSFRNLSFSKKVFLVIFLYLFLHYSLLSIGNPNSWVLSGDGHGYYAPLRSFIIDHDLDYENEFRDYNPHRHAVEKYEVKTETGHVRNRYPIGMSVLWAPFFVLAHILAILANTIGYSIPLDGYSFIYQYFVGVGTLVYAFLGALLLYKIGRRFFDERVAATGVAVTVLATNFIYYAIYEPTYSHIGSMFAVSLFVYLWIKDYGQKDMKSYMLLGAVSGLMILVRYQDSLFLALPLVELIDVNWEKIKKFDIRGLYPSIKNGLVYLASIFLALIPQFMVWKIIFGKWLFNSYSYTSPKPGFIPIHFLELLFASKNGLITWTPIILFAFIGLYFFIKKERKFGLLFLLALALQLYFMSSLDRWWSGHSFSARNLLNCAFVYSIGISAFIDRFRKKRLYLVGLFILLIIWNSLFMIQYVMGLVPHGDYISWRAMIRNQFWVAGFLLSRLF